jgi:hypothetical protein
VTEHHVPAILQLRRRIEALAKLRLSPSARLVAWALLLHADARGECWPGTASLRRLTCLDVRTIKRVRRALLAAFNYAPGGSERGARRRPSHYQFRLDWGQNATGPAGQPVTTAPPDRGPLATSTGGTLPSEPVAVCPPKNQEGPSEGPPNNGMPSNASVNVGRILREVTDATAPPWPSTRVAP